MADLVLRRHLGDVETATRTRVQAWIENGQVTVNGRLIRRVASRAALGDVVTVVLPDKPPHAAMAAEDVGLSVLYEDGHLLAIDKPPGVVVHPTYRHTTGTIMNALLWHARDWKGTERPCLVNRLDKLTSGIVLVAKTPAIQAALQKTTIEKDYLAVVYGRVNVARGKIDMRLRRDRGDRRRVVASTTVVAPSVTPPPPIVTVPPVRKPVPVRVSVTAESSWRSASGETAVTVGMGALTANALASVAALAPPAAGCV